MTQRPVPKKLVSGAQPSSDCHKTQTVNKMLSSELSAIVSEMALMILVWEYGFSGYLKDRVDTWARKQPFWDELVKRKGNLARNGQTDVVLMFVLGCHHCIAGSLMMLSGYVDSPSLWKHGALLEFAFELCDLIAVLRSTWPYNRNQVAPDLRFALLMHHIPGIVLLFPVFEYGLNKYVSLMKIGGWLLLGACFSAFCGCLIWTRDFSKPQEMKQAAILQTVATLFFIYVRWYEFPIHLLQFAKDVERHPGLSKGFSKLVVAMGVVMCVFNFLVTISIVPKMCRYVNKAFITDNVDLNDADPVEVGDKDR